MECLLVIILSLNEEIATRSARFGAFLSRALVYPRGERS